MYRKNNSRKNSVDEDVEDQLIDPMETVVRYKSQKLHWLILIQMSRQP